MNRYIEVCVRDDVSTTERGRVLERFARRFLETQNYAVIEEVRLTGMEVDLLAQERTTSERIIVECKAHRSTIPADVLIKLYGKVAIEGFASGWLISTHDLGKDAKGVRDRFLDKAPEERRKLQVYDPASLIDRLVGAGFLVSPEILAKPEGTSLSEDVFLLLAQDGAYWALIGLDDDTRMRRGVYVYDAHNGNRVIAKPVLSSLAATDTSLATLTWEADDASDRSRETQKLNAELQSVVRVQPGDHWADYRPARPEDYVGRENLQKEVADLFDRVRSQTTATRVFAIKGPSGWGKSSSVLKIADRARSAGRGKNVFVYAVDSRAATSRRFVELALYRAFKEAVDRRFITYEGEISVGGPSAPLSTDTLRTLMEVLRAEKKIICVIFDQFEELLYKEELSPIFEDVRLLCDSAIEAGENFIVDNIVRDMVVVGHAEANRKTGQVLALHQDVDAAARTLISFCRSHVLYHLIRDRFGVDEGFFLNDAVQVATEIYSRPNLSASVLEQYASRVLQWCIAAGLVDRVEEVYFASNSSQGVSGLTTGGARNRRGRGFFLGGAPPERVEAALAELMARGLSREELVDRHGAATFEALCALGFTDNRGALLAHPEGSPANLVREAAADNPSLHLMREALIENPHRTGPDLGRMLEAELQVTWSEQTCNRNGNSLRRWVGWAWPEEFVWKGRGAQRRLHHVSSPDLKMTLFERD